MISGTSHRHKLTWVLALALIAGCGMGPATGSEDGQIPSVSANSANSKSSKNKRRVAPEAVETLTLNGKRFSAIHWGKARGLDQNGGYILVSDEVSGAEVGIIKVYRIRYGGDMERDKQDVFITYIRQSQQAGSIEVGNENGQVFQVDIETGKVTQE